MQPFCNSRVFSAVTYEGFITRRVAHRVPYTLYGLVLLSDCSGDTLDEIAFADYLKMIAGGILTHAVQLTLTREFEFWPGSENRSLSLWHGFVIKRKKNACSNL